MSFKFEKKAPYFFKDASLSFQRNMLHFVQGKNGSGKSTFFRILQGSIHDNEQVTGTFSINSHNYTAKNNNIPYAFTKQIKTVQQDIHVMIAHQFSVEKNMQLDNLTMHPNLRLLPPINKKLSPLLEQFNIDLQKPAYLLSGGQQQILAIIMALQKPTNILLLDEPTAALDEKNAHMVMAFLQELAHSQNLTILIITHDKELVDIYAPGGYTHIQEEQGGLRTFSTVEKSNLF